MSDKDCSVWNIWLYILLITIMRSHLPVMFNKENKTVHYADCVIMAQL